MKYGTSTKRIKGMNKLELAYSQLLEFRRKAGEIDRWDYEPEKLRLADKTFYTPDFRVIDLDGAVEFHETKGFMRDDAVVKIKVAAETHPYVFKLIFFKRGQWDIRTI